MAPLANSLHAGLVSCVTQELENHQLHLPSSRFHTIQASGSPTLHLCLSLPAADTPLRAQRHAASLAAAAR